MAVNRDNRRGDPPAAAFRADVAYGSKVLMEGAEPVLFNPMFIENAKKLYGGTIVEPELVYVNLNGPTPSRGTVTGAHCDTPNFRGMDKDESPYWLLHLMNHSGLFSRWQIDTATAVCWYYRGVGGEFWCWPNGPENRPIVIPPGWNTGIMSDNDRMFHTPAPCGAPPFRPTQGMTIDSTVRGDGQGNWVIEDAGRQVITYSAEEMRIVLYWRAQVFRDEGELAICRERKDDMSAAEAIDILVADARGRGAAVDAGSDPLNDQSLIATLSGVYGRSPSNFGPSLAAGAQ